jgi:hypothetical protein
VAFRQQVMRKLNGSEIEVEFEKVKSKPKSYGTISYQN